MVIASPAMKPALVAAACVCVLPLYTTVVGVAVTLAALGVMSAVVVTVTAVLPSV